MFSSCTPWGTDPLGFLVLSVLPPAEVNARVLLSVAVVLAGSHLVGWAIAKIGQPRVIGEILAGILLGPSLLGAVWPGALDYLFPAEVIGALRTLAQVGLVLFMFLVGVELDLDRLVGQGRKALVISQTSIAAPLGLGVLLSWWLYPRFGGQVDQLGFTLFLGAAMAITAFPVLARVLQETGLTNTRIGVLAITCAAIDDITAWCVLAGVVAIVESSGLGDMLRTIALSVAFVGLLGLVVRPVLRRVRVLPVWLAICLAMVGAWATEQIGIHAIFGAFMVGAMVPRRPETRLVVQEQVQHIAVTLLLPVFFVVIGLSTRIDTIDSLYLWGVTAIVVLTAVAGKLGGCLIAARLLGEPWREAAALGVLMNTRGLTELVILTVGLELGVISSTLFTIMVVMALVTTLVATPLLSVIAPHHRPLDPASGSD